MKRFQLRRRARAAQAAFELGRVETLQEREDREDRQRQREAAERFTQLVTSAPQGVWFPTDGIGPAWTPGFFKLGRE